MKYIRTNTDIYKVNHHYRNCYKVICPDGVIRRIPTKEVIKKSDCIEELCDSFVIVVTTGPLKGNFYCYKYLDYAKHDISDSSLIIYAAILTESSINFVAKLNDEGEWELL